MTDRPRSPAGRAGACAAALAFLAMLLPGEPLADFETGRQAFDSGDYEMALKELRPDAEGGDPEAQTLMGLIYIEGRGMLKDPAEGVKWLRRSAEQGEVRAQGKLAAVLLTGRDVPKDVTEAALWYRRAAEQGHLGSQFILGLLYHEGTGVPANPVQSCMWLTLSARYVKEAIGPRNHVAAELGPVQTQFAESLAAAWRPKHRREVVAAAGTAAAPAFPESGGDYLSLRKAHATVLQRHGPAPPPSVANPPPDGVTEVTYPSGELTLKAWLAMPVGHREGKVPAVVFFGGGFSVDPSDLRNARPFLDSGYALLMPMLRGHNGNPGSFELFYGEVEDGRAAIRWLAAQPGIDPDRIYTFGHSIGGGISALLSLWDDVPVRLGGSSGGIYDEDAFYGWRWTGWVPFNPHDATESRLRLLVGNTRHMKRPHIAYLGSEDHRLGPVGEEAQAESQRGGGQLTVVIVPGSHGTSLQPAIAEFLKAIEALQ